MNLGLAETVKKPTAAGSRGFRSYTFNEIPNARQLETWAAVIEPFLTKLYRAFPNAQPVGGALPVVVAGRSG